MTRSLPATSRADRTSTTDERSAPAAAVVEAWLRRSAEVIHQRAAELTELDARIGDGDHGINLDRGFAAVLRVLDAAPPDASAATLLRDAGRAVVSTVGGASGPLYGTFLLEVGARLEGIGVLEPGALATAWASAAEAVGRRGRSTVGQKTMLDALVPAAERLAAAAVAGDSVAQAVAAAAQAADEGLQATVPMIATRGRASYLGERSRGHADPGATSSAILTATFAESVAALDATR